jgi:hypothetical protein
MTKVILTLFFDEFPNLQIHSWEMWWFGRVCALKALPWIGSPLRFSRRGFMGPSFRRTFISAGLNGGMQLCTGAGALNRADHSLRVTVFTSVYCSSPYSPNSRPIPDCLNPPNGALVSST